MKFAKLIILFFGILTECPVGTYGLGCAGTCGANCKIPNKCHNENGHCEGCKAGKQGAFCDGGKILFLIRNPEVC